MANSSRDAPRKNAFQLVRMPKAPPTTSTRPAHGLPYTALMASAVGSARPASVPGANESPTVHCTRPYHPSAITIESTMMRPMVRNGMSISSASCGMTSNPTYRNGVMIMTRSTPSQPVT